MSLAGSGVIEVFQLNKNSKEDDLEQCIQWLKDVFYDQLPKTINVVVKRLGAFDPLNTTHLSKAALKGLNSTLNSSLIDNTNLGNQTNTSLNEKNNQKKEGKQSNPQKPNEQNISQAEIEEQINSPERKVNGNNKNNQQRNYNENDPQSVSEKAKQLYKNKQFNEAIELYKRSNDLTKDNKLIFQNKTYIGDILIQNKQRNEAIKELSLAYQMKDQFNANEIIEQNKQKQREGQQNEQNQREGQEKFINSNPLYYVSLTLGNLYNEDKDYDKAIKFFEEAQQQLSNCESIFDRKYQQSLISNSLGMIYYAKNDIKPSIEKFKESLEILEDLMKNSANNTQLKISYANRLSNQGEALRRNKEIDEAIKKFQISLNLKIEVQNLNKDNSTETEKSIASTYNNLGQIYFSQKKYNEAFEHLNKAVQKYDKIVENKGEVDQISFANILNQRGDCNRHKQDLQYACEDYKRAYNIKVKYFGEEDKSTLMSLNSFAQVLFQTKDYKNSKQAFKDLLRIQKKKFGEDDPQVAQTLNNLATVLSESQEYEEAGKQIDAAIKIFEKIYNESEKESDKVNLERVKKNYASITQKQGKNNPPKQ